MPEDSKPEEITNEGRVRAFIDLYKQQMERFRQTQALEWKATFGVWTLLAGAIYFISQHPIRIPLCAAGIGLSVFVIIHWLWLRMIHQSERVDKKFWVRYRMEALRLLRGGSGVFEDETEWKINSSDQAIWSTMILSVTFLLCAVLFYVVMAASKCPARPCQ